MGDERLVARVRAGDDDAFEAIYDRYYLGLLAFCRHMLGSRQEAEDALQHSFASAYRALRRDDSAVELRPWLYTIARNRCLSTLRARRDEVDIDGLEPERGALDGLPAQIQLRSDLRDLVEDMQRLPDDQRAALVLFELGDHSHDEIGTVLGVRREKVKALVFQARSGLLRARRARDASCVEIREQIATTVSVLPKRGLVRAHIERCEACAAFEREVRRQRSALAAILPVVPSAGLKATVLGFALGGGGGAAAITGATVGGGGAAAGGGAVAGALGSAGVATVAGGVVGGPAKVAGLGALGAKGLVTKVLAVVAVAGGGGEAARHVAPQAPAGAPHATSFARSPMSVLPQRVLMGHPATGKQIAIGAPVIPVLPGPADPPLAPTVPSTGAPQPDATSVAPAPAPAPIAQRPIVQPPAAAPGPTVAPTTAADPSPGPSADPAPTATDPDPAPATTTTDPAPTATEPGATDTPPATSGGTEDSSPAPSTTTPAPDPDALPTTVPAADATPADNPPTGAAVAAQS